MIAPFSGLSVSGSCLSVSGSRLSVSGSWAYPATPWAYPAKAKKQHPYHTKSTWDNKIKAWAYPANGRIRSPERIRLHPERIRLQSERIQLVSERIRLQNVAEYAQPKNLTPERIRPLIFFVQTICKLQYFRTSGRIRSGLMAEYAQFGRAGNSLKKLWFLCIHSKILPLGLQKSTPLSRIRHGVTVLSREFEGQIADPR